MQQAGSIVCPRVVALQQTAKNLQQTCHSNGKRLNWKSAYVLVGANF